MNEKKQPKIHPRVRVFDQGVPCPSCGCRYDHRVEYTYSNTRRRMRCGGCKTPFVSVRAE